MGLLIIVLLALGNGILAMSEAALIATRKPRLVQRAQEGHSGANDALELLENPDRFLSTVQIGITLIGVLAGAFGGATVADDFAGQIAKIDMLKPYADSLGVASIVGITTYLSLVIGELVPKQLAMRQPESIISRIAPLMRRLAAITAPISWILYQSSSAILWLLNADDDDEPAITEAEIKVMMREGHRSGIFQQHEREMVESVFRMDFLVAEALMTPRTEIEWLDANDDESVWRETALNSTYSRLLVRGENEDDVVGIVLIRDILAAEVVNSKIDLHELTHAPIFIPENLPAPSVLERLRGQQNGLLIVIDEFGGVQGIITLQDVIEAVVGDIENPEAVQRSDGSWLIDGLMPLEEFKALLNLTELPDEDAYHTVAGFVINQLGAIPEVSQHFVWESWQVEVMDMDGNRVDKVLLKRLEPLPDSDDAAQDNKSN